MKRLGPHAVTGFLVLVACYGYFLPRIDNVNSTSRMDLVYAIADKGTIRIDDFHKNTIDKAYFRGHYYTEKSVGPSVIAVPVYIAFRELAVLAGLSERPRIYAPSGGYDRRYHGMALIAVTFVTISVPSALAATLLFLFVRPWVGPAVALLTMLAYGIGTIAFPYSSQFYSHQIAAVAIFGAFFILSRVVEGRITRTGGWAVGALMGFALITEYVTVVFASLILAWVVHSHRDIGLLVRVLAAASPWILLATAYNLAAFQSPLPIGYAHTVFFGDVHSQGLLGLTRPTWDALYGITFSPYRGLFFLSPFLVLSAYGFVLMWRAGHRSLVVLFSGMSAVLLLYNASYVVWWGGYSIGPRHLIPLLPFVCVPVAWALRATSRSPFLRLVSASLLAASVASVWIQSIGGSDLPAEGIHRPLTEYSLPQLLRGDLAFNVGMALGIEGHASLIPWVLLILLIMVSVPGLVSRLSTAPRQAGVRP